MTRYDNIYHFISDHRRKNPASHYFDHGTLKFFGERLSEMRILRRMVRVRNCCGELRDAYCLSTIQRPPFSGGRPSRHYAYFDAETLAQITM